MEFLALLGPFPYVLWLTGTVIFALSLAPRLEWLRTTALVVGVLGSALGYLAIRQHWSDASFGASQLLDYQTAHNFFVVVWPVSAVLHMLRYRFFPGWMIPGWTQGIFLIGLLLGSAYLVRASRPDSTLFRAAVPPSSDLEIERERQGASEITEPASSAR